ncbi:HEAT repeat domain-containing protein [Paludisphaera mucosa]|uniref:HEAT repeat domain-containing protein n=1 Tax=Paludisphaera mucosa TaxID=3030827 RepID=A0ABT6FJS7_9BACT|nr:HEAT repeat domain-containing protein [Paludisphaera mucosa]MDG3007802.1 HEAT repeat domain-containing protein [Paludisphaera mucosa]
MAITFSCASCGKRYSVDDALAGRRVRCKACAQTTTVPQAPLATARDADAPPPAGWYDDDDISSRLKSRPHAGPPAPSEVDDAPRAPRRAGVRPTRSRPAGPSTSELPILVKVGLGLIGVLVAFSCLSVMYYGLKQGHPEIVPLAGGMLLLVAFAGLAVVCNLKLLFRGYREGYGGIPWYIPFRRLIWISRNLKETGPLVAGNLAGLAGAAASVVFIIPAGGPNQARRAGPPGFAAAVAPAPGPAFEADFPAPAATPGDFAVADPGPAPAPGGDEGPKDPTSKALAGLTSSDAGARKRAAGELVRLAPEDGRRDEVQRALRPLLDDPDGFFVLDVARAMAAWATPETVPALIAKTRDERFGVRWEVIKILGELGDPRAAEAVAARLKEDGIAAAPALRKLGAGAEGALVELLKSPDPDLRREACNVLKDVGGSDTLDFMKTARPDPDPLVRMTAQQAMQAVAARVGTSATPSRGPGAGPRP